MSSPYEILKIQCAIIDVCPLYIEGYVGALLYFLSFYPIFLTWGLFFFSFHTNEFYLFMISIYLEFDQLFSDMLKCVIDIPALYPGCGSIHGMPAFSTQHAVLIDTLLITYILIYKPYKPGILIFFGKLSILIALFSCIYIGANDRLELFVGAMIGFAEGIIFQIFTYWFIKNYINRVLNSWLFKKLSIEDNMCKYIFS